MIFVQSAFLCLFTLCWCERDSSLKKN